MEVSQQGRAVRVWLGYALPALSRGKDRERFYHKLGSVFIPATVQFMGPLGLQAYVPTVVHADPRAVVPDEIALVFYPSPARYHAACDNSCAGRAYGDLHGTVFNFDAEPETPASHSAFPALFDPGAEQQGALQVLDPHADWQQGTVISEVRLRQEQPVAAFQQACRRTMAALQSAPSPELRGVYLYLGEDLLVCWTLWAHNPAPVASRLGECIQVSYSSPLTVPVSPFADDPGVTVTGGDSLNLQFTPMDEPTTSGGS